MAQGWQPRARVKADFQANGVNGVLDLRAGEFVIVREWHGEDGWCGGHKDGDTVTGWFPAWCLDPDDELVCDLELDVEGKARDVSFSSDTRTERAQALLAIASPLRKRNLDKADTRQVQLEETRQRAEAVASALEAESAALRIEKAKVVELELQKSADAEAALSRQCDLEAEVSRLRSCLQESETRGETLRAQAVQREAEISSLKTQLASMRETLDKERKAREAFTVRAPASVPLLPRGTEMTSSKVLSTPGPEARREAHRLLKELEGSSSVPTLQGHSAAWEYIVDDMNLGHPQSTTPVANITLEDGLAGTLPRSAVSGDAEKAPLLRFASAPTTMRSLDTPLLLMRSGNSTPVVPPSTPGRAESVGLRTRQPLAQQPLSTRQVLQRHLGGVSKLVSEFERKNGAPPQRNVDPSPIRHVSGRSEQPKTQQQQHPQHQHIGSMTLQAGCQSMSPTSGQCGRALSATCAYRTAAVCRDQSLETPRASARSARCAQSGVTQQRQHEDAVYLNMSPMSRIGDAGQLLQFGSPSRRQAATVPLSAVGGSPLTVKDKIRFFGGHNA